MYRQIGFPFEELPVIKQAIEIEQVTGTNSGRPIDPWIIVLAKTKLKKIVNFVFTWPAVYTVQW